MIDMIAIAETLAFMPSVKIAKARQNDLERTAYAPKYDLFCNTEEQVDKVIEAVKEKDWMIERTGPFSLTIDPSPNYEYDPQTLDYDSVWGD